MRPLIYSLLALALGMGCAVVDDPVATTASQEFDGKNYVLPDTEDLETSSGGNQVANGGITNAGLGFSPLDTATAVYLDAPTAAGTATTEGTVDGLTGSAKHAFFDVYGSLPADANSPGIPQFVYLVLSDNPNFCHDATRREALLHDSLHVPMLLHAYAADGTPQALDANTYTVAAVAPARAVAASYYKLDAQCTSLATESALHATSGTVTVNALSVGPNATLAGTYSLGFGLLSDRLSGLFTATPCSGLIATFGDTQHLIRCDTGGADAP